MKNNVIGHNSSAIKVGGDETGEKEDAGEKSNRALGLYPHRKLIRAVTERRGRVMETLYAASRIRNE